MNRLHKITKKLVVAFLSASMIFGILPQPVMVFASEQMEAAVEPDVQDDSVQEKNGQKETVEQTESLSIEEQSTEENSLGDMSQEKAELEVEETSPVQSDLENMETEQDEKESEMSGEKSESISENDADEIAQDVFDGHEEEEYDISDELMTKYGISGMDAADLKGERAIEGSEDEFTYEIRDGKAYLTSYKGDKENLIVPSSLGGYPLVGVCQGSFRENHTLKSVTFSEGLEFCDPESFFQCSNLESIYLPDTFGVGYVTPSSVSGLGGFIVWCENLSTITVSEDNDYLCIYDGALYTKDMKQLLLYPSGDRREIFNIPNGIETINDNACSYNSYVKEIVMPNTVIYIGYDAFCNDSALKKINISEHCEIIGQFAIRNTSITELHIPASVTWIMKDAITVNTLLEEITVDENNTVYYTYDGALYHTYKGALYAETELILYPAARKAEVYEVKNGTVNISWSAFRDADVKKVVLPDTVKSIERSAFWECKLEEINLPITIKNIDEAAFANDYLLKDIYYAGNEEYWSKIEIGDSNEALMNATIHYTDQIQEPQVIVTFDLQGHGTEQYIEVKKGSTIDYPISPEEEGYKFTGWYKEAECITLWNFETDTVEENIILYAGWEPDNTLNNPSGNPEDEFKYEIREGKAYLTSYKGNKEDLIVPASLGGYPLVGICQGSFRENHTIKSITFSEGLEFCDSESFFQCSNLESIHLPATFGAGYVTPSSFRGLGGFINCCENLSTITVSEDNKYLCVYDGALYTKDMKQLLLYPSGDRREVFNIPDGVEIIGDDSCAYNSHVREIVMPNTVTYIGYWAFCCDSALKKINISERCEMIGQFAIRSTSVTELHIPASVTWIMDDAITTNSRLEEITVHENNTVYYTYNGALYHTYKGVLYAETKLILYPAARKAEVYEVKNGTVYIGESAFWDADVKKVVLPDTVKSIEGSAFWACKLEEIDLPITIKKIADYAFANDGGVLKDVYYAGNEECWSKIELGASNEALINATIHYSDQIQEPRITVTFDLQGHGTEQYIEVKKGSTIERPISLEEEGYKFTGWYKEAECITLWNFETDTVEEDIILYAGWELENTPNTPSDNIPEGFWIEDIENCTYTGKAIEPSVSVYYQCH